MQGTESGPETPVTPSSPPDPDPVENLANTRVRLSTLWKGLTLIVAVASLAYQYDGSLVKQSDLQKWQDDTVARLEQAVAPLRQELSSARTLLDVVDQRERSHSTSLSALQALMDAYLLRPRTPPQHAGP